MAQVFEDGIGISNVHERLRVLYGADFRMDISSQEGEGTRIRIDIPELVPTASDLSAIFPATKSMMSGSDTDFSLRGFVLAIDQTPQAEARATEKLKNQFQAELNLPGERSRRGDKPGGRADCAARKRWWIRRAVVGAIEDVEKLRAKLQVRFFRDTRVLKDGKINVGESRSAQRASAEISVRSGGRQGERRRIEPLIRDFRSRPDR